MHRRGFTLIELLVVIGVLAALSSMLIPAIMIAQNKARDAKCMTLISQVKGALEKYKINAGIYPEGPARVAGQTPGQHAGWAPIFGSGTSMRSATLIKESDWQSVNGDLLWALAATDADNFRVNSADPFLRDPYTSGVQGNVLRYRPARFYPFTSRGTNTTNGTLPGPEAVGQIDSDDPPMPDSYQIWSIGRDGIDQYGVKNSDDKPGWTAR